MKIFTSRNLTVIDSLSHTLFLCIKVVWTCYTFKNSIVFEAWKLNYKLKISSFYYIIKE